MNPRFRRGLVVGKFSPLHLGHESVIRRALAECEHVVLLSYAQPELPGCSAARRAHWLRQRFPTTPSFVITDAWLAALPPTWTGPRQVPPDDAPDIVHRQFVGQLCLHSLGGPVDAVFTSESYGDGFAAELTSLFRALDPHRPPVVHVLVDQARHLIPTSGTAIRADVHAQRAWLSPEVYASFVERVAFLGGESSGKSTLVQAAAARFQTISVAEYGRELWEAKDGQLTPSDMPEIGRVQIAREEAAHPLAHRFLFCDTTPMTTLWYSREMFACSPAGLELMAERRYDRYVLCALDIPFVQDGTRQDDAFRRRQDTWYRAELTRRGLPFLCVHGTVEQRLDQLQAALFS